MARGIVRAPAADADALAIWVSIARDNLLAADRMLDRIDDAIQRLGDFAYVGASRGDIQPGLRQLVVDPYLVLYHVRPDDMVEVRRIVHGRRNLADL